MNDKRLQEVFNEARKDQGATKLDGKGYEARMRLGIKISKENMNNKVKIYDYSSWGNYYVEMRESELMTLNKLGWLSGVLTITLDKYKLKLEAIKRGIARELNANRSNKKLHYYKEARQQVLNKYYKLTQKLNKNET